MTMCCITSCLHLRCTSSVEMTVDTLKIKVSKWTLLILKSNFTQNPLFFYLCYQLILVPNLVVIVTAVI